MVLVYEVEKSLAVKNYSHPFGEKVEESSNGSYTRKKRNSKIL